MSVDKEQEKDGDKPKLDKNISLDDYLNYYWLKSELMDFCREIGIDLGGWKLDIHERIVEYLTTKKIIKKSSVSNKAAASDGDSELSPDTVVLSNFKRNPETTKFLKSIDARFHYSVKLNQFIRDNIGEITYGDIVREWRLEYEERKRGVKTTPYLPQCEYNQFVKDYLADNKGGRFEDAVTAWNVKKKMRGDNVYRKEELDLYFGNDS